MRDTQWSEGTCGSRCEYEKWENIKCFENPIVVFNFALYNIISHIGCRYV